MRTYRVMLFLLAVVGVVEGRAQLIAYDTFSGYSALNLNDADLLNKGLGTGWTGP
jgi:hypothetical protein